MRHANKKLDLEPPMSFLVASVWLDPCPHRHRGVLLRQSRLGPFQPLVVLHNIGVPKSMPSEYHNNMALVTQRRVSCINNLA